MTEPEIPVPFEALLAHRAWLRTVARALVADENDADDLEQQTWLLALERPPARADSVRGWLLTATRNVARKLGRGRSRRQRHEIAALRPEGGEPDADLVAEAELQQRLGRAVLELEQPFRATVLLRYFEGLSVREVAARLDVPVDTVKSRLRRAHERLRERLDEQHGGRRAAWALAAIAWRDGPAAGAPPTASAATAVGVGGVVMTTTQKLVAAAILVVLGLTTWTVLRARDAGPVVAAVVPKPSPTEPKRVPAAAVAEAPSVATLVDDLPLPVDLDRCDRDLDLHGIVVDEAGKGVAGATVATVTYPWRTAGAGLNVTDKDVEEAGPSTRSSRDGTFSIRLTRGASVGLRVAAEPFASVELPNVLAGERVRVTLRAGVRLAVTVLDAAGAPVEGAVVRLFNSDRTGDPAVNRRGTTGPGGLCAFDGLTPGTWAWFAPEHAKGGVDWTKVTLPASGELRQEVRLPKGRTITGRVRDAETGIPIDGARVGMGWVLDMAVTTRADGRFELPGWTGSGHEGIDVLAEGYARESRTVGNEEQIDFALWRGYAVTGRVVDEFSRPVAGARVGVIGWQYWNQVRRLSNGFATSDADGRFRVTSLFPGMRHALLVTATGFARLRRDMSTTGTRSYADVHLGDVVLAAPRRVEGVVLGPDEQPHARVPVSLYGPVPESGSDPDDGGYGRTSRGFTDDLGRFRFADVAHGEYSVTARPKGSPEIAANVVVAAGADVLDVRLAGVATGEIVVTVVDTSGAPVSGATLNLSGAPGGAIQAPTDGQGVARLNVPVGGKRKLMVMLTPEAWKRFVQPKPLDLDDDATTVKVVLEIASAVTGRIVDPDGAPVAHAHLEILGAGDARWKTTADEDGRFRVLVPGSGRLALVFAGSVGAPMQPFDDVRMTARVEDVARDTEVTVRCERAVWDRRVSVVVLSPDEAPVAKASVSVWSATGNLAKAETDAAGRAVFEKLPARELDIGVSFQGTDFLPPVKAKVTPDGQDLRLVCRRAVRITGAVVGPNGDWTSMGSVLAFRDGRALAFAQVGQDGRFSFLFAEDDVAPVRLQMDTDNDGKADAFLEGVVPGTADVRLVVAK